MEPIYILKNKNSDIIGCFQKKENAHTCLLDYSINKLQNFIELIQFNSLKINIPDINNYSITTILLNTNLVQNNETISIDDLKFSSENVIQNKLSLLNSLKNKLNGKTESNPVNTVVIQKPQSDVVVKKEETRSKEEIKKLIEKLKSEKNEKLLKIKENKKNLEQDKKLLSKKLRKENRKKQKEIRKKERLEERKRKFEADKKSYKLIKEQITSDEDIPELFRVQFPIMKEMEDNNIFGTEDEFNYYNKKMPKQIIYGTSKYNNIFGNYVPHTFDTESEDSDSSEDESDSSSDSSQEISTDDIDLEFKL